MPVEEYYRTFSRVDIRDSTLCMQMNAGFEPSGLLANYLNDPVCDNYSVLLVLESAKNCDGRDSIEVGDMPCLTFD